MAPAEKTGTVLVVDDEPSVRNTIRRALESKGFKVVEASDGFEAMEQFGRPEAGIGLVVLDVVMPGMSGWDVLVEIKSLEPEIPVLLVSGYALAGEPKEPIDARADGFLHKPFELAELIDSVERLL